MADNEIIHDLESEISLAEYVDSDYCDGVDLTLIENTLDFINRQQEEIERLRKEVNLVSIQFQDIQERYEEAQAEIEQWKEEANRYQKLWCIAVDDIETAKSEAIKEFAKKLHTYVKEQYATTNPYIRMRMSDIIDKVVKEMVGEEK